MNPSRIIGLLVLAALIAGAWSVSGTTQAQTSTWLSSPPSAPGSAPSCPDANQWLLLYWGGPSTAIATAATTCPGADLYWSRQGDRWLGFSQTNPAASDAWTVQTGEAAFVHGLTSGTPVPGTGTVGTTVTATSTTTVTLTATGTATTTPTVTATVTTTPTVTVTPTVTATVTATPTVTATVTPTVTPTGTAPASSISSP